MLRLVGIGDAKPVNFLVDTEAVFYPGQMAQLKVVGNKIICGLSDGTRPCGIIDDINDDKNNNSTVMSGMVTVWMHNGIFETDQYDVTERYTKGATLYCNKRGRFTVSNLMGLCPAVAIVIKKPSKESPTLELVWK